MRQRDKRKEELLLAKSEDRPPAKFHVHDKSMINTQITKNKFFIEFENIVPRRTFMYAMQFT